jgi:endonuclease/exonuclease/phosphatase family metal-dependent hydrolase
MRFLLAVTALMMTVGVQAKTLKVMQYNLENLFDTQHDVNTEDYTYLPLSLKNTIPGFKEICQKLGNQTYVKECLTLDWNEAIVTKKIQNLAKVIKSFDATGKGPDILIVEEIENKNILNKLVTKGLSGMGYQYQVLIEGDDSRGIDVAVVSKFPVTQALHHSLVVNGVKLDTRGILEVKIAVENQDVVVFANHWPSQSNPVAQRIASARLLNDLSLKVNADLIIAAGDFNTINTDVPSPFGALTSFIDSEAEARKAGTVLNPGTHYYQGAWTSLDHIFIHTKSAFKPLYKTFQIFNRPFVLKPAGHTQAQQVPNRFNVITGEGFSDHLAIGMNFEY